MVHQETGYDLMLDYTLPFGKKNRGLSVVVTFKMLVENPTETDLKLARILGWCVELLQAFFLMSDDIMDASETRRSRVCWYKIKKVGMIAINDSFYVESCIYELLKKYFKKHTHYVDILELFHETTVQTVIGQCLDTTTARQEGTADFSKFTVERYSAIVKWKTAFYSFYLPVALGMHMAGINDQDSFSVAKSILLQMGHFFQVQDDFLDCYGDPEVIGKIGTDIEDNKCSWLIVQALKLADPKNRQILQETYGRSDPEKVKQVKDVYHDLNLKQIYSKYEESSYTELTRLIEKSSDKLPQDIFLLFAQKIYKREK